MTGTDAIIWFALIFAADIVAMILDRLIQAYRSKAREAVLCEICHRPRKTRRTFDRKLWVCRRCNTLYIQEFKGTTNG